MARLEKAYSSTFGSESAKGMLYGGFYTLFGGIIAGLAAIVLLYVANSNTAGLYDWRKVSFTLAAFSGALIFLGISMTLPSKKALRIVGSLGFLMCVAATAAFWAAYPLHFNVPDEQGDYTEVVVGVYVLGVALVLTGTFTSLVGYYLDRVQASQTAARGGPGAADYFDEYEVPDSVIEKDIEYAMKKYKYAWGEGQSASSGIQINIKDEFEAGTVVGGGKGVARTVTLEAPQVDDATKALRGIRPGAKEKTMATTEVDAQTNALLAFRKQKMDMQAQKAATRAAKRGWWARLMQWLGLRKSPSSPKGPTSAPSSSPTTLPTQKVGK
jgi:hypothetical protein